MMDFILIDSDNKILKVYDELKNSLYISIDTESDGLYAYDIKLCLLQIESNGKLYIIDPLAVDISILKDIFENPEIEKIFHSAYSDISIIKKKEDITFKNIFDIMIASKYIYKKAVSLKNLVKIYFNVDLDKKFQKINWSKRPFNTEILEYAAKDVYYLKKLRDILKDELIKKQVYDEFIYSCELSGKVEARRNIFSIDRYINIANAYHLEDMEKLIFLEMVKKREEIARTLNLPPFKIITNELMIYIAKHYDEIINAREIKLYNKCIVKNIEWIRKIIEKVFSSELDYLSSTRKTASSTNYEIKLKMLKKWRKQISQKANLPCELVIDIKFLKEIAKLEILDKDILKSIGVDEKRIETYGSNLIEYFNSLRKIQ